MSPPGRAAARRVGPPFGVAAAVSVLGFLYGWPLLSIAVRTLEGVAGGSGWTAAGAWRVLSAERTGHLVIVTVAETVASTAAVLLVGVPLGWAIGRFRFPGRRLFGALLVTPFVLPSVTVAGAVLAISGPPGGDPERFVLIIAAHAVFNIGFMARATAAALAGVPRSVEEAARMAGRRGAVAALDTTGRAIAPSIAAAAGVVAALSALSFGVIAVIGSEGIRTVEMEIWARAVQQLDLAGAATLALAQGALLAVLFAALGRWGAAHGAPALAAGSGDPRPARTGVERAAVTVAVCVGAFVVAVPLLATVFGALRGPGGWTLQRFGSLAGGTTPSGVVGARPVLARGEALTAFGDSLAGAGVATLLAFAAAALVLAARRGAGWLERLAVAPMAVSGATLGLGFLLAFGSSALDLRGSWIAVPLVQGAVAAPVVTHLLSAAWRNRAALLYEHAATLGAGPWRRFASVLVPSLRPVLFAAGSIAFAIALGEFGATSFVARSDRPTVPLLIARLFGRVGSANYGAAMALSAVLVSVTAAVVWVGDRRGSIR
ncbi:MAG: ABC transporter permease subunit [Microthrixaceae bacterium]